MPFSITHGGIPKTSPPLVGVVQDLFELLVSLGFGFYCIFGLSLSVSIKFAIFPLPRFYQELTNLSLRGFYWVGVSGQREQTGVCVLC